MSNLLDLLSEEDRAKAQSAYEKRMAGDTSYRKEQKISPEIYLIAEFGYYYGWGAVEAAKRGYIEHFDEHTGERKKMILTLEEIAVLVEAARKVWYSKVLDTSRGSLVAVGSAMSKNPGSSFKNGMKPFTRGAQI